MVYFDKENELFINYLCGIIDENYIKGFMNNESVYTPSNYMINIIIEIFANELSNIVKIKYSIVEKPLLRLELLVSNKQYRDKLDMYNIIKRKINIDKI